LTAVILLFGGDDALRTALHMSFAALRVLGEHRAINHRSDEGYSVEDVYCSRRLFSEACKLCRELHERRATVWVTARDLELGRVGCR